MYVARAVLWYGIWSRHSFNSCVIVTTAMPFSTAQVVNTITSEWNISWDTDSVLTQRGYAHMLNYKHFSPHSGYLGIFSSKQNLCFTWVLRIERYCRVWKPSSENQSYHSFLVCSSDLGRLQTKTWIEKQCKFCNISEHFLLKSGYILKTTFTLFSRNISKSLLSFKVGEAGS